MFNNFFKITFRNLSKNKSYVFINIIGLGLSMACCIVAYLNASYVSDFDKNHINHNEIFNIHTTKMVQGNAVPHGITPLALGHQIKGQYPEIIATSRYTSIGLVLKKELKVLNKEIAFVDDDYFEMFTFPVLYGSTQAIQEKTNIILSQETSQAYFGDQNPVGEIIYVITDEGERMPMTIGAVLKKIPSNTSMQFDAIAHFDNYRNIYEIENNNWSDFVSATFIMTDGSIPKSFISDINTRYVKVQNEARENLKVASYHVERLTTLGVNSETVNYVWLAEPPPPAALLVPNIMAILLLLIACFNFTNTSIAISSKRLKEIGIRKVMGSRKGQLILQFLGENIILTFFGLLFGLLIAYFLVPAYSALWDFIDLELSFINNYKIYLFLLAMILFTSVIAGAYPALYISSFQPVRILKGTLSVGGTNLFSRFLLGLQYLFTIIALIAALAFSNNAKYQSALDVGFTKDKIISIRVENQSFYDKYANTVSQIPGITQVAGSSHHIGQWHYSRVLKSPDLEIDAQMMNLGINYANIMELKIKEGRYFAEDLYDHDKANSIIVNEQLVREYGWENPIGQVLRINDTTKLSVIGVMSDFYMFGFFDPIKPSAFRLADKDKMNFVIVKSNQDLKEVYENLEKAWYDVSPNSPFNASYQSNILKESEEVNENITVMFQFLGLIALLLSSIGLYTLVSLNILKRIKEIGVRKVLGSSIAQILVLFNKQFFWLLLCAAVLGTVLSYFAIDFIMAEIFAIYQALNITTVLIPFTFLLTMAIAIASTRIYKSAIKNPVHSLRYE